ncbi:hypothetical protein QJQ45_022955, partial [Haematococcus lacustris]
MPMSVCYHQVDNKTQETQALQDAIRQPDRRHRNAIPQLAKKGICCIDRGPCTCAQCYTTRSSNWLATSTKHPHTHSNQPEDELPNDQPRPPREPTLHALHADLLPRTRHPHTHSNQTEDEQPHDQPRPLRGTPLHASHADLLPLTELHVTEMPTDHADMQDDNKHGAQTRHHLPALTATALHDQLAVTEMPTNHADMQADVRHGTQPHHHLPALTATDLHGQLAVTEMPPNHADMQADNRHGAQPHHHLPALTATALQDQLAVTEMPTDHADMQADNRHGAQPHHHLPALTATDLHGQLAVTEMPTDHADMQADNRHGAQPHHHLPALTATALHDQLAVTEMPTNHADMQANKRHDAQPHHHLPALTATDLHGQLAVTEMPPNHADMQADNRHGAQPQHHLPALTATTLHDQLAVTEMPPDHADMQADNRHGAQPHHHLPALTATALHDQLAVTEMPTDHADMQADNRHGAQPHHHLPALTATDLHGQLAVTEMPPNHADMQADNRHGAQPHHHLPALTATALHGQLAVTEMPPNHADMQADNRHGAQPHHHLPALTATTLHDQLAVTEMPTKHADMQADIRHGTQPHHHLPALTATALHDQLAVTETPPNHADMQADNRHGAQPHHHLPALTATALHDQLAVTEMPTNHADMQADIRHGAQPHHHLPALTATALHDQLAVTEMPPDHADMQADNRHGAQPHHHLPALTATALHDQLAVTEMPPNHADMQANNRHDAQPHHHLPALTATDLLGQLAVTEMPPNHADMQADNRHGAQPHHHLPALTATALHDQLAVTEMPTNHADMQANNRHDAQPHHHLPALTATDLLGQLAVTEMPPNHADMQADNRHGAQPHHHLPALTATALHDQLAVTEMPTDHADMQADNRHGAQPHHHLPALTATDLHGQLAVTEMPPNHADMQADNRHGAQPHHHLPALTATDLHGQLAVTEMPPNHADMQADIRHGAQPHHHLPALTATTLHDQLAVTEMPGTTLHVLHADLMPCTRSTADISMPVPLHTEAWEGGVLLAATPRQGMIPIEPPPVYSTVSVNLAATRCINLPAADPSHPEPDDIASTLHSVSTTLFGVIPNSLLTTGLDSSIAPGATFDISIAGHCLHVLDSAGRSALSPNLHRCTTPEALVLSLTTLAKDAAPALTIINTSHSTSRYTPSRNLTATRCAVTFTCSAPAEQYREAMQQALMLGRKVHNFTHLLKGGTVRYGGAAACQVTGRTLDSSSIVCIAAIEYGPLWQSQGIPDLRHAPLAEQVQTLMQLTGTSLTKTHAGNLTTPAETATFLSRASLEAARLDCLAVRVRSAGDNKVLIQSNSQAIQQANASLVNSNGELKGHTQLLVPNLFCITLRPERQPGQQYSLNDTAALSTVLIAIHTNIGVGIGKLLKAPALASVVSQNPGLRNSLVDSIRFLAFTGAEVGFHAAITNPTHVFTTASGQALAHATTAELRGTRPRENQLLMADNASLALVSLSLACTPEVGTIKAEGMTLSISVGFRRSPPPDRSTAASILATAAGAVQSGITLPPPAGCEGIHTKPLSLVKITELPTATLLPNLVHIFKHTIPTALSLPGATQTRHALVVAEQDSTYADLLEGLSTLDDSTIDAAVQQALPSSAPAASSGRDMGRGPGRGVSSKGRGRASDSGNARQPQQPTQVAWARHEGNPAGHAPEDEDHLGTMDELLRQDPPQAGGTTGTAHLPGEELSNLPGRTMPGTTGGLVWGARRVAADARDPLAAPLSAERAAQRPRMSTVHLASSRSLEQQLTAAGTPSLETGPLPASEDAKMADGEAYVTYSINPHTTYTIDNIKRLTMGAINYLTHIGWLLLAAGDIEPNPGPEGPYFEKQVAHHCQIHALNMVVGHPWLSNQDLANFHTSELNARQGDQMWALARDEEGACNDTVVNLYLTSHYGLSTHTVAHLKTGRDWSTRHLDALAEAHGITAFLCKAPAHSMAIRKHNDTWYLLDSEATTPTPLQVTGNRAYHAACEIQTITTISHPTAAMTAARTRARLGPIISTTRHTFTAAAVCIGARPGPTNPRKTHMPYWESQHKKCCLVHAINMAMGEPMINPEDVITHCKTLDTHIQDLATKARQEHRQIPLHNNLPHIYHDQGNFTISTINHYLYHYHKDLHLCPTTQELPYGSITRELLTGTTGKPDSHTNTVAAILFTDNHATTIRHMDNAWHWLDSERGHPQRLDTPAAWSQLHGRLVQIRKGTAQNTNLIEPLCWLADPTTRATTEQLEQHLRTTYVDLTNLGRDTPAHSPHADRPTPRTDTSQQTSTKRKDTPQEDAHPPAKPTQQPPNRQAARTVTLPTTQRNTTRPASSRPTSCSTIRRPKPRALPRDTHTQTSMYQYLNVAPTLPPTAYQTANPPEDTTAQSQRNTLPSQMPQPTPSRTTITLTTFNVRGLHRSRKDVLHLVHTQSPDILILTETMTQPKSNNPSCGWLKRVMPNYIVHRHRGHSEVLIGIKHDLAIQTHATMLPPCTDAEVNTRCVILTLRQHKCEELTIVATYWPSGDNDDAIPLREKMQEHIRTTTERAPGSLILAGDINATMRKEDRYGHTEYTQDRMMRKFADKLLLFEADPGDRAWTYQQPHCNSRIDAILTRDARHGSEHRTHVDTHAYLSDHRPLTATLTTARLGINLAAIRKPQQQCHTVLTTPITYNDREAYRLAVQQPSSGAPQLHARLTAYLAPMYTEATHFLATLDKANPHQPQRLA